MNVFISSVIRGLEDERNAAAEAVGSLGHTARRSEDFGAPPEPSQIVCRAGVRECDITALLLGERCGDIQASGKSATHEEYEEAKETDRPVLAFVKSGITPEPGQRARIEEVRDWVQGEFHGRFTTSDELRAAVVRAVDDFELRAAVGPADPAEMRARLEAAIPNRGVFTSSAARLLVGITGGPRQVVLRPQEIEDPALGQWIQREAMFGSTPVFATAEATQVDQRGDIPSTCPAPS